MDTNEHIHSTTINYYHNKPEDKHYFGGFLNLAQNNINQIFDEFCIRLGESSDQNVFNIIGKFFSNNTSYSDWEKRIEILKEYLPVTDYLNLSINDSEFEDLIDNEKEDKRREYFRTNLVNLIKAINNLRNFYTHYYHSPLTIDENTFSFLDSTLLKVCLEVKQKKMKDDKTRQILKQRISEDLEKLRKLKIEELKEKKKKNKRIDLNDKTGIQNAIYNDAFKHLIYNEEQSYHLKDFYKSKYLSNNDDNNNVPITKSGLIFILSMFLTKKETEQLKANIKGYKAKVVGEDDEISKENNSLKYMATHWVFSYLSFKGLKRRVKTTFDKTTLLTQMIDELSKIPDDVYQTLSSSNKEEFLEDINEFLQESSEEVKNLNNSVVVHPVIRKRYEDKFNYFAIRFLDEFANFPTLKFQVFAGFYRHNSKEKEIKGSNLTTNRIIKERINVFGKLSEVAEYKQNHFKKSRQEESWDLFPNPSYNTIGNNIHIYIDLNDKNIDKEIVALKREVNNQYKKRGANRITKQEIVNVIYSNTKTIFHKEPTVLFSLNELPAFLYELLINNKSGEELEKIITQKVITHFNTIKNYDAKQQLSNSFIPKKLNKGKAHQDIADIEKLLRAINKEIEITRDKLNLIKANRNECKETDPVTNKAKRKYIFYTNELGREATWLAYDLKRFMPRAAKKQWKGYQHSELQRYLAFYEMNKTEAEVLLTANWDLNSSPTWGSNIKKAFKRPAFDSFYQCYLEGREKTLAEFREEVNNFKNEPKILKKVLNEVFLVFDKRLYVISNTEKQKKELLAKPIVLPRGIFDEKPTYIHEQKIEDAPDKYADWYRYCYDKTHKFQNFYTLDRDYTELFSDYQANIHANKLNKKNLTHQQMFELFKKKQDLVIKKVMHKDLFVKLMIDYLFKSIFGQDINIGLNDIYQTKNERLRNQQLALKQKDREKGDISENIKNVNFIWNKTISMSLFNGQIKASEIKLKDIGKFRRFETDIKVHQILAYDSEKTWDKLMLEDELENRNDSYERIRREKLLKAIQMFEKHVLEKQNESNIDHPLEFEHNGNPNFRRYIVNGVLTKTKDTPQSEINWLGNIEDFTDISIDEIKNKSKNTQKAYLLILLRNKFGHNQLPSKEAYNLMQTLYSKEDNETYSSFFYRVAQQIINEFSM